MSKKVLTIFALVAFCAAGATAQRESKDAIHLTGTVSKIAGDTVTVSVGENSADVMLEAATTYKIGAKPAARSDLQVGDAVNALVVRANSQWQAQAIKITHPKK